jgi:hypothetical protein
MPARELGVASRAVPVPAAGRLPWGAVDSAARSALRRSSVVKAEVLADRNCRFVFMR